MKNLFFVVCLLFSANLALADCPAPSELHKQDICVMNNMDQALLYAQSPDDIGTFGIPAHAVLIPSEADHNAVEVVDLHYSQSETEFKRFQIETCSVIKFYNKHYTKVLVNVVRGCV